MPMKWRKSRYSGVWEAERANGRKVYRGRRRHPTTGAPQWGPTLNQPSEVLTWIEGGAGEVARAAAAERAAVGVTFRELATTWREGVEQGAIAKRHGKGGYSDTTWSDYCRSLDHVLLPQPSEEFPLGEGFGDRSAAELDAREWQMFVDRLARKGLSRSRIAGHLAVASAIYGWASRPTRRIVESNPTLTVEMPPVNEKPRLRVCSPEETVQLLLALAEADRLPYEIAFYAGLRRAELHRLEWADVDLTGDGKTILVRKAKSEAGSNRRIPIPDPLLPSLKRAKLRQAPGTAKVLEVSVMSGKIASRCREAWGWEPTAKRDKDGNIIWKKARKDALVPIGLHECRHTYASTLVAAGYDLRRIMEYLGHSSLQATERYVKLLPQPAGESEADKLNDFYRRAAGAS